MNKHTITLSQIENQTSADFLGYVVNWRLMNIRVQEADLKAALDTRRLQQPPACPTIAAQSITSRPRGMDIRTYSTTNGHSPNSRKLILNQ